MSERPHHDMGTCWCGELHAREHVLARRVEQLETALRRIRDEQAAFGTHTGVTHTSKHGHAAVQIARAALDKDK